MVDFHPELFEPAIIIGIADAGVYSILAVALVLTYRVSRTIGFLHYGIAVVGAYGYYGLTVQAEMSGGAALVTIVAVGAAIGAAYGTVVTNPRISFLPRITLSMVSLSAMLVVAALATLAFPVRPDVAIPKSPFGPDHFRIWSYNMTYHRLMSLVITLSLVIAVWAWMNKTRSGVNVRAISDDVEVARWSGIRLVRVGIGSYAAAGALSAMAGALLAPVAGTDLQSILLVFFRALTVAVVGGFRSPAFAFVGALVLSLTENFMAVGAAGDIGPGTKETVILLVMVATALAVAKMRKTVHKLEVEAL